MEFEILGSLVVRGDGRELALGAAKPRALLVRLLVDANRAVPAEQLIDDLWEGDPPRTAAQTLQGYVSQLRKVLGAERLISAPGGYQVVVADGELDVDAFDREVVELRRCLADGDAAAVVANAERALRRWRGRALTDAAGAAWAVAESARLDELRLVAVESSLEARLMLGEHAEVVAAAEAAVADQPLRERLWSYLITALYRQGRQAEALRAFQRLRRQLADELGIDPSPELQELEAQVLRQQPELAWQAPVGTSTRADLPIGVVTFVLTDLVGSTRLWETAPGDMAGAVARHEELLREAVEARGGVLLKSRGEGDSTFSVFQRASDAIAAAIDARAALLAEPWPAATPIEVRIAVHTGETEERAGDYFGRTVNRAARLRAVARAGVVTVSQATAELVIDDLASGWHLVELGVQELRDIDRPERVFLLQQLGAPSAPAAPAHASGSEESMPLPRQLVGTPMMGFVGRSAEREQIATSFKQAVAGSARVVLISGEPGIGKTSLAAEIARSAHGEGATVLFGRCDEDIGVPYRPWIEALGHLVEHLPIDAVEGLGTRRLADLSRLIPAVNDRVAGVAAPAQGDADADRWSLFTAVTALAGAACATAALVVVLDDLQRADKPTLLLLRHVVEQTEPPRLLVIGTYRDSDLSAEHPLTDVLASLRREANTERVPLRGLADREVVAMVESMTGRDLESDGLSLVHAVYRETDGNPFFTEALLRHLAETGAVYLDEDGRWVPRADLDEAGLPDSVREVIGQRVARIGEQCQRVLHLASVIGLEFDLATVVAAAEGDADDLLDALEAAVVAGLVVNVAPGQFAFAHGLVANTLYTGLTPTRRARLHHQVALAIESVDPTGRRAAELARHWAATAAPLDAEKAVGYARSAGDLARRALAPDEAVRWYGQALELLERYAAERDGETRCDLLVRLGRAQRDVGSPVYRSTLLEAARLARRVGNGRLLARAALANSRGWVGYGDELYGDRVEMLEAALAATDATDAAVRARLLATLAAELRVGDDLERCRALADEAVAIARGLEVPALLVNVINLVVFALWQPELLNERLAITAEALALAETIGDPMLLHWSAHWRMHAVVESGHVDEAERLLDLMTAIAGETGQPALQWANRAYGASLALLLGDTATAARLSAEAIKYSSVLDTDRKMVEYSRQYVIAWYEDRLADELGRMDTEQRGAWHAISRRPMAELALASTRAGQLDEAKRLFAAEREMGMGTTLLSWLGYAIAWAEVCEHVGTSDDAVAVFELMLPFRDQVASNGSQWYGSVAHPLGTLAAQLGRLDEADEFFAQAAEVNERIRAPFFLARTRVAWARMLLQRREPGDRERALGLLAVARQVAREYGYAGIEQEITELLAAPAAQPDPPPLPPRLTAATRAAFVGRDAELEVLDGVLRAADSGEIRVALIAGEPGIGKSTLAAAAAGAARSAGAWVIHGRCDEDLRVPYGPFVDALTQLVEHLPDGTLDAIGDRRLGELARLVPAVADRRSALPDPPATDPETERYLVMNAVAATLTEASSRAPLVFVIDDLHWADKPTLVLLRHLLSSTAEARLMVVATYRPTDLDRDTPLTGVLPNLTTDPSVHHFALGGLNSHEVASMTGADPALADALHRETDGNPLFTAELYRHLQETGSELRAGVLPDAVRGLVRQRVGRLGDDVRDALATAAAIGQEFDLALLARVLGLDADDVVATLERAEVAALVETVAAERFAFAHALVQRALYDELAATRRARTHRRIAETIEALGLADARVTELARHWAEAAITPADYALAAHHAAQAGDRTLELLAPDEAVRWFRQALELHRRAPDGDDHATCGLLLRLAQAQLRSGDRTFRQTRLEAADLATRLGDTDSLVQAALTEYQRGYVEVDPDARSLLEAALKAVGGEDSPARARLLARLAYDSNFSSPDRARRDGTEAVAIARRLGDPETLADVLSLGTWLPAWLEQRRAEQAEALALAEESGDPTAIFSAAQHGYTAAVQAADVAQVEILAGRMTEIADEVGRPDMRWIATYLGAERELLAGNMATAERLMERAFELGRGLEQPGADVQYAAGLQSVRWHQGRQHEAVELVASAAQNNPHLAILRMPITLRGAAAGDDDLRVAVDGLPNDGSWILSAAILADIIAKRGQADAAAALYEQLLPFESQFSGGGTLSRGPIAHSLAILARTFGRPDDAEAHFVVADDVNERMQTPFFQARTWLEWAATLLDRRGPGDVDRAVELLTRARDVAVDRGYAQVERRANRVLATAAADD